MLSNNNIKIKPYTHKSMDEFKEWSGILKANLTLHKHKLQTVVEKNELHHTIKRNIKKELKEEKSTVSDNDIKEREKETLEDMNELVYSIIIIIGGADWW